jgi:hypothetical protein
LRRATMQQVSHRTNCARAPQSLLE